MRSQQWSAAAGACSARGAGGQGNRRVGGHGQDAAGACTRGRPRPGMRLQVDEHGCGHVASGMMGRAVYGVGSKGKTWEMEEKLTASSMARSGRSEVDEMRQIDGDVVRLPKKRTKMKGMVYSTPSRTGGHSRSIGVRRSYMQSISRLGGRWPCGRRRLKWWRRRFVRERAERREEEAREGGLSRGGGA